MSDAFRAGYMARKRGRERIPQKSADALDRSAWDSGYAFADDAARDAAKRGRGKSHAEDAEDAEDAERPQTMFIDFGRHRDSHGYYTALVDFEKRAKLMNAKMAKQLEVECDQADKFIGRLRKAIFHAQLAAQKKSRLGKSASPANAAKP